MIKTKHINEAVESDDGVRVLTTRYWPRGTARKNANWDRWLKVLGPSKELLVDCLGNGSAGISWVEYSKRFLDEIDLRGANAISELVEAHERGANITLLCDGADEKRCHRRLVKQVLERWEQWLDVPGDIRFPEELDRLPSNPGSYILQFELARALVVTVGVLGRFRLGPGRLRYYGSAYNSGGLRTRLARHLDMNKNCVGHADWLTVKVMPTKVMITDYLTECGLCQRDLNSGKWEIAAKGFGKSGDTRNCEAHLLVAVNAHRRNEQTASVLQ